MPPGAAPAKLTRRTRPAPATATNQRIGDALSIAQQQGLLAGSRTRTIRGRMPSRLVEQAKLKSGIQSDSSLLEAALASLVVSDDYGQWLLAQRGSIGKDLNLEF